IANIFRRIQSRICGCRKLKFSMSFHDGILVFHEDLLSRQSFAVMVTERRWADLPVVVNSFSSMTLVASGRLHVGASWETTIIRCFLVRTTWHFYRNR